MKKYLIFILSGLLFTSCVDNNLLPDDKTVEEDFWKTKSDVSLMVSGVYKSLIDADVIARCIVWGDFRSDDINPTSAISISNTVATDLKEMNVAGTQPDNTFSDWSSIYSVINNCNVVLAHAADVMKIDPSYTEGDYNVDKSQMLALRSLCYFYLVRTFRDVPYTSEAYQNSSQNMELPQTSPDSVLQCCINDLEEAEKTPLAADGYKDWRRVGLINVNGIDALLADIYLWRASMTHNSADYSKCVEYCNKVIASKQLQYPKDQFDDNASDYPLEDGASAFDKIFITGNSKESIFELQMDGTTNTNISVCQYYYMYGSSYKYGYTQASKIFGVFDSNSNPLSNDYVYCSTNDYRFWENCFSVNNSSVDAFNIRKMVDNLPSSNSATSLKTISSTGRGYANFAQNWILYRLSDVMLMKAEALVQLAASNDDVQLAQAYQMVKVVNNRSLALASDTIAFKNFKTRENMEKLVLSERQRELCFEGKRWFDLMRYSYRHMTDVDIKTTLAKQSAAGKSFSKNYQAMLTFLQRKYTEGGAAVTYKMSTEPMLYLPILTSELKVNKRLVQNPGYQSNGEYIKQ